jgi:CheY-like chemotaxis protein
MRYRIALCGFSEFEYRAMQFSFEHPASPGVPGYDVVDALGDADFAVVDADARPAVKGVLLAGRTDQAVFVGAFAPPEAAFHLPRPIDPRRILQALHELSVRFPVARGRRSPPPDRELPLLDDAVDVGEPLSEAADAALQRFAAQAPSAPLPQTHAPQSTAREAEAKAAARAAARRARMKQDQDDPTLPEPLQDVLVLDPDDATRDALCSLLEQFGFAAQRARTVAEASARLPLGPFAALFLDIAIDSDDGIALLDRIRELPVPAGHAAPVVLMLAAHLNPADRVRATLAGMAAPLIKPVGRGDVARALEGSGVRFPADARRL